MLATGERIGETLAVLCANVSLDTGEVDCTHQIQRVTGKGLVRIRVKSEAGERRLLLPGWAVDMLRARWQAGAPRDSPVFPDLTGGFRDPHNVRKSLRDVRTPIGSERRRELGRVLRTHRRQAGFTQQDVVNKLGWKKTRISLIETGRVRLDQEEAGVLADTYQLPGRERTALPRSGHHLTGSAGVVCLERPGRHMYRLSVAIWCTVGPNNRWCANVLS